MKRYDNFVYFFLSLNSSVIVSRGDYDFQMEPIELTYPTSESNFDDGIARIQQCPLSRLEEWEQIKLCDQARDYAIADPADPITSKAFMQFGIDLFGVRYPDGTDTTHVALICPTIPRIYVRTGENDVNKILIMERRNPYLEQRYEFSAELVQSVTRVGDFVGELEQFLHLVTQHFITTEGVANSEKVSASIPPFLVCTRNLDRQDMCMAARKRLHQHHEIAIVSEGWTENAAKFDVEIVGGRKLKKAVAFPCNSKPLIYLRALDETAETSKIPTTHATTEITGNPTTTVTRATTVTTVTLATPATPVNKFMIMIVQEK